jgi:FixJ family two-component response regulator
MANLTPTAAVVDDEESVGRAIKRLLGSAGIEAEVFTSGDAFLAHLSSVPGVRPGCVILDILMPGIGGLEVQRQLAGSGLPVIIITAHDDASVRAQVLAAGAIDYLRKPFDGALLIRTVQTAMGLPLMP